MRYKYEWCEIMRVGFSGLQISLGGEWDTLPGKPVWEYRTQAIVIGWWAFIWRQWATPTPTKETE